MSKVKISLLVIIALTATPLLFIGGVEGSSYRSLKSLWNCGHIPFFYLWSFLFIHWYQSHFHKKPVLSSLLVFTLAFVAGLSIEVLQALIGRQFSWLDLGYDMTGTTLAVGHQLHLTNKLPGSWNKAVVGTGLLLILGAAIPTTIAIIDETNAYYQFPVLADFSTPFETDRFSGNSSFSRIIDQRNTDNKLISVTFNTNKYSSLALNYFNGDWQKFHHLRFDVFNPDTQTLRLVCKINDHQHRQDGYIFSDRFNGRFELEAGWQQISIALDAVKIAPEGRQMDMANIADFSCFTIALEKPSKVFFDNFRLTN